MKILDEMWAALTACQPQADAAGHGKSWARMCSERTYTAASYAADAAFFADAAADAASHADKWAQRAIYRINEVLVKQAPPPQEKNT